MKSVTRYKHVPAELEPFVELTLSKKTQNISSVPFYWIAERRTLKREAKNPTNSILTFYTVRHNPFRNR